MLKSQAGGGRGWTSKWDIFKKGDNGRNVMIVTERKRENGFTRESRGGEDGMPECGRIVRNRKYSAVVKHSVFWNVVGQ